jgi:hypothetical protein
MISFRRTCDMDLVRRVMTHPKVWPWISDDFAPAPEDFQPLDHPGIVYVEAIVPDGSGPGQEKLLGLWIFAPQNGACWEVHTCLLPGHGFLRAREAARAMAEWIWEHTACLRIVTNVPRCNRAAYAFARAAGMQEFGTNEGSYMKNGRVWDQIMLGLSRPEAPCQRQ